MNRHSNPYESWISGEMFRRPYSLLGWLAPVPSGASNAVLNRRRKAATCLMCCLLLTCALVGCGGSATGTAEGKVLLNNAPFTEASLVFLSMETGQGVTAAIAADGSYRTEGDLPVGAYTVFLAPKSQEHVPTDPTALGVEGAMWSTGASAPPKYWNEATSDITVQIESGANEIDVRMQAP
jgi:hypothetical protein